VLRKIFGPKREEGGSWRNLHNDELHSLYSSPNIVRVIKSRRMRWVGHVARMGQGRGVYRVLVGRPESKRPVGRPRRRWEDNIKMDLREIGIDGANWIRLAQDRVQWRAFVNTYIRHLKLHKNEGASVSCSKSRNKRFIYDITNKLDSDYRAFQDSGTSYCRTCSLQRLP
jgi:hypothetical protein